MKIINTKYGFIEKDGVKKDFEIKSIIWPNVFAYLFGFLIIGLYFYNWFLI